MFARSIPWIGSVVLLLAVVSLAEACPTCKESLASGSQGERLVRGYFWSIIFMMSMPFTILGGLSLYMYMLVRRARREQPQPLDSMTQANSRPAGGNLAV